MSRAKPGSPDDLANASLQLSSSSRRRFLLDTAVIAAAAWLPTNSWGTAFGQATTSTPSNEGKGDPTMDGKITTKDGVQIYYKDWGKGQPILRTADQVHC